MKRFVILLVLLIPLVIVSGCCTDDICNVGSSFKTTCNTCNVCTTCNTCNTCGYDSSYTYSSWY